MREPKFELLRSNEAPPARTNQNFFQDSDQNDLNQFNFGRMRTSKVFTISFFKKSPGSEVV